MGPRAHRRLARGLKLNRSETVALVASQLQELIRDGEHGVAELMDMGKKMLGRRHVLRTCMTLSDRGHSVAGLMDSWRAGEYT